MSRYIDADALKEWIDEYVSVFKKSDTREIKGYIEHQPTIDAVSVVRCKECKYWRNTDAEKIPTASIACGNMHADDFCSYGERRGRVMIDGKPRIGDEVYIHGYIDEIRNDVVIIRNEGGYFGTSDREMFYYEEDERGYGTMNEADRKAEPRRGKWILTSDEKYEYCTCSECGYENGENWMIGSEIPYCANCGAKMVETEPSGYNLLPVDKDINVRSKTEPRKEQNFCGKCRYLYRDFKYGLSCYRLMDNEPCKYEKRKAEPQTSCKTCRYGEVDEGYVRCAYYSKATEQDEPQTEPLQTCSVNGRPYSECFSCEHFKCTADEPQTDCKTCKHKDLEGCEEPCLECKGYDLYELQTPYDDCQSCLHWVYDGYWYCECNECRYEPKDEPQTDVYDYKGNGKWERSE